LVRPVDEEGLKCADLLTGEPLWTRKDVPRGSELLGDDEVVIAAAPNERMLFVISMIDGRLISQRPLGELSWLLTTGRNIARLSAPIGAARQTLLIADAVTNETIYAADYTAPRLTVIEPNLVLVYEPTGKFHAVDVRTGTVIIDHGLEAYPNVASLQGYLADDTLIVATSGPIGAGKHQVVGADYPLVNGFVYAFSLETAKPLWPAPAVVRDRGLGLHLPADLPLVVFADRESQRDARTGNMKLRLLCLDRRTGEAVYHNDDLPDTVIGQFQVSGLPNGDPTIQLLTSAQRILLTATDEPRSPEPPANDDLIAPREYAETGLRAVARQLGDALQEANRGNQRNPAANRGANRRGGG
jgi:outer membrane protein assembly factor BamB